VNDLAAYIDTCKEWTCYQYKEAWEFLAQYLKLFRGEAVLLLKQSGRHMQNRWSGLHWNIHDFSSRIVDAHPRKNWSQLILIQLNIHLTKADIRYSMEWLDSTFDFCNPMNLSALIFGFSDWFSTCLFVAEFQRYYLGVQQRLSTNFVSPQSFRQPRVSGWATLNKRNCLLLSVWNI